jgi:uncharacterized PurR-regulated membrane protein YhhQ (DUF165 family)
MPVIHPFLLLDWSFFAIIKGMNSTLFTINARDFAKGLIVAILAAVLTYIAQLINVPGFSFAGVDWSEIARIAVASGVAYIIKNFLSDNGKILGIQ